MNEGDDPYKVLGVSQDASATDIKKAYRKLALQNHPDKQDSEAAREEAHGIFAKISNAYEILSDEEERRKYDLRKQGASPKKAYPKSAGDGGWPEDPQGQKSHRYRQRYQSKPECNNSRASSGDSPFQRAKSRVHKKKDPEPSYSCQPPQFKKKWTPPPTYESPPTPSRKKQSWSYPSRPTSTEIPTASTDPSSPKHQTYSYSSSSIPHPQKAQQRQNKPSPRCHQKTATTTTTMESDDGQSTFQFSFTSPRGAGAGSSHPQFHDPYEIFKQVFGEELGKDFNIKTTTTATTPKNASRGCPDSPIRLSGMEKAPPTAHSPTISSPIRITRKKTTNGASLSSPVRVLSSPMLRRKKSPGGWSSSSVADGLGVEEEEDENPPQSISSRTRTVTHPDGQVETVTETTITRQDGSVETVVSSTNMQQCSTTKGTRRTKSTGRARPDRMTAMKQHQQQERQVPRMTGAHRGQCQQTEPIRPVRHSFVRSKKI